MATVVDIPILNIVSDEEGDEDDEEKDMSEGSSDHRVDDSSSSSDKGSLNGTKDEEEEEGEDKEGDGFEIPLGADYVELGLEGCGAAEDREVVSQATKECVMLRH